MSLPSSFRLILSFVLAGILVLSIVLVKNRAVSIWNADERESAQYRMSPGCFPTSDPSDVDNTLPPCTDAPRVVTAKFERRDMWSKRRNPPKMDRYLTLRDDANRSDTVNILSENLWNEVNVGNSVTVTVWRGKIQRVAANGDSTIVVDWDRWEESKVFLIGWSVAGFTSLFVLSALWGRRRRYGVW